MHKEYMLLYGIHGEGKPKLIFSNQLNSKTLSLVAADDEINAFARKLADQFTRLPHLFKNPANAARVLCDIAHDKYGITPPWINKRQANSVTKSVTVPVTDTVSVTGPVTSPNTSLFPFL